MQQRVSSRAMSRSRSMRVELRNIDAALEWIAKGQRRSLCALAPPPSAVRAWRIAGAWGRDR